MERLTILVLLTITVSSIAHINAKPCSSKDLKVFNQVSDQVNRCRHDSKLNFEVPPRSSLTETEQSALCTSKVCQTMIGAVDDLDIPKCEAAFDKKNMTLQMSLDKFVSSCDTITPTPSPMKRRKSFESSASGSDSLPKKRRHTNLATAVYFGTPQQLVVLVVVAFLSLGLAFP